MNRISLALSAIAIAIAIAIVSPASAVETKLPPAGKIMTAKAVETCLIEAGHVVKVDFVVVAADGADSKDWDVYPAKGKRAEIHDAINDCQTEAGASIKKEVTKKE